MATYMRIRKDIIEVLDEESAWSHVVMSYIHYVVVLPGFATRNSRRIAKKLNRVIGDTMQLPKTWRKLPSPPQARGEFGEGDPR